MPMRRVRMSLSSSLMYPSIRNCTGLLLRALLVRAMAPSRVPYMSVLLADLLTSALSYNSLISMRDMHSSDSVPMYTTRVMRPVMA